MSVGKRYWEDGKTFRYEYRIPKSLVPPGQKGRKGGFLKYSDCAKAERDRIKEFEEMSKVSSANLTFAKGAEVYLEKKRVNGRELAVKTKEKYETFLRLHINPTFGDREIKAITPLEVDDWVEYLKEEGIGIPTIDDCIKITKAVCNFLVKKEVINAHPFKTVQKFGKNYTSDDEVKFFTPKQVQRIFRRAGDMFGAKCRMIIMTAFYTGMRPGEIYGLDVKHFHYDRLQIDVRQQFNGKELTSRLKNKQSRRSIDIDQSFADELKYYIEENNIKNGLIFTNEAGNPINKDNFNFRWWKPILRSLKFDESMHFNYARHTFASVKLTSGEYYMYVSVQMGHASPLMTLTVYGHWIPEVEKPKKNLMSEKFCERGMNVKRYMRRKLKVV